MKSCSAGTESRLVRHEVLRCRHLLARVVLPFLVEALPFSVSFGAYSGGAIAR